MNLKEVSEFEEVVANVIAFNKDLQTEGSIALRRFSQFSHWYYIPYLDLFGPSKFIGYKNMGIDNYSGEGDGRDTQQFLNPFFDKVENRDPHYPELTRKLKSLASSTGKDINSRTLNGSGGIYIPKPEFDLGIADSSFLDIKYLKNVTNDAGNAYLKSPDVFTLHWPEKLNSNILAADPGEIICLFQKGRSENTIYLTHLVTPVDRKVLKDGYGNYQKGRSVRIIAVVNNIHDIPLKSSVPVESNLRNRAWGRTEEPEKIFSIDDVEDAQLAIWDLFRPYFRPFINNPNPYAPPSDADDIEHEPSREGKVKLVTHLTRERNRKLVNAKKAQALQNGTLHCEVCEFSFIDKYGQPFIECHHDTPIHKGAKLNGIEDLSLVCPNCHRMLHRKFDGEYHTVESLRKKFFS
ncbi:HNH endonuclease [Roseivirga sp. BDSF3-8]|uniref:HNH endonuclease n=1 Tax=Roseivirga sp. BDSF3-8 TaxID=3241598 RepID=UPI0035323092